MSLTPTEKLVQSTVGGLMPVCCPERWEDEIRPGIAILIRDEVCAANNRAQVVVLQMGLRHDRELEMERARHAVELEALQQLLREALQEQVPAVRNGGDGPDPSTRRTD